jgi:hypothetical protein
MGSHPQHHNLVEAEAQTSTWWAVSFIPLHLKAFSMTDTESAFWPGNRLETMDLCSH